MNPLFLRFLRLKYGYDQNNFFATNKAEWSVWQGLDMWCCMDDIDTEQVAAATTRIFST